jgi:cobalt-zinc-cadmium efflux system membrane fusion protein
MKNKKFFILISATIGIGFIAFFLISKDPKFQKIDYHSHAYEPATNTEIKIDLVGPALIKEIANLTGRVSLNRNNTATIKARFKGLVRQVEKKLGDQVKKGELLAKIEANDSLRIYPLISPINGTVLSLQTNIGDVADDEPLFIIADLSDLWAEFNVFPDDINRVHVGQTVRVDSLDKEIFGTSQISSLLPLIETATKTVVARAPLENKDGQWRAGMAVLGQVQTSEQKTLTAVKTSSLQTIENKTVVYIKTSNSYQAKIVKTGLKDEDFTEILDGLKNGDEYVSNSFLIKDNLKSLGSRELKN